MVTGTTLAIAAIASTAISTGATIYSGIQQSKEAERAARAQQAYQVEQARAEMEYERELQILQRERENERYNLEYEAMVREYEVNEYNARLQEQRADQLELEAERAEFASRLRAQDEDQDAAQLYANILSQQAASGTVIGLGSNAGMLESTKRRQRLNRLRVIEQGTYEGANLRAQAGAERSNAGLTRANPVNRPTTVIDTPAPPRRAPIPLQRTRTYGATDALATLAGGVSRLSANQHVMGLVAG